MTEEIYVPTKEELQQAMLDFRKKLDAFPSEEKRKHQIIKSIREILVACGCEINNDCFSFGFDETKTKVIYSDNYGEKVINVDGLSVGAMTNRILSSLIRSVKELKL